MFNELPHSCTANPVSPLLRVLIFTVLGQRDPKPMLESLHTIVQPGFDLVLFLNPHPPESVYPASKASQHHNCLSCWHSLTSSDVSETVCSIGTAKDLSDLVEWIERVPRLTRAHLLEFVRTRTVPEAESNGVEPVSNGTIDSSNTDTHCHVLVTGSLYLVGAALKALNEPV
ncbi:unnamed protein product [Echinostoma caproni]|uniref:UDP-Glycosyltransferase superfamily protein n=1 Tax=Echinostoma caproni TaxID=27848 RepID=A0A183AGF7_9TREM|nr:unnamed protein product [Echinostoma caproni]